MFAGEKIFIRPFTPRDVEARLQLQLENRHFFEMYSMARNSDYYTVEGQRKLIEEYDEKCKKDLEYNFGIFTTADKKLIGTISLFQVVRGSLQSAFIGYFIDKENNGKGYATEAIKLIVEFAFTNLHLHRIEAGVMPHNIGSIRVLEKSGFHKEGIAMKNVKINGKWEDHQVLAIINPND
ncbi:GNAT family N-acetyltransferase [Brevibacillus ruminantium]|uniref:GNAT family N-acetyltransferase n=1 Tax=Brevibacillus ruminantium TaxID=2950604 RepID=A0ABY4WNQ6_9BACL|nr:GNAT family protein [Brevibacillus ruminantium]USG68309.1 GNAT family N-acetyltransferase [Brevibacillus ruminantium]